MQSDNISEISIFIIQFRGSFELPLLVSGYVYVPHRCKVCPIDRYYGYTWINLIIKRHVLFLLSSQTAPSADFGSGHSMFANACPTSMSFPAPPIRTLPSSTAELFALLQSCSLIAEASCTDCRTSCLRQSIGGSAVLPIDSENYLMLGCCRKRLGRLVKWLSHVLTSMPRLPRPSSFQEPGCIEIKY